MKNTKISCLLQALGLWVILSITMTLSLSAAPLKIMMLGDSITSGAGPLPENPESNTSKYDGSTIEFEDEIGYRGELWTLLKAAGYTFGDENNDTADLDFVGTQTKNGSTYATENSGFDEDHEGHGGFTSKDILEGKDVNGTKKAGIDNILNTKTPDIVLMHIGTNDPGKGIPIGSVNDNTDANTTVNNVKKMLNAIFAKNKKTKVFVARIIEARRANEFITGWSATALNDEIAIMIERHPDTANIKMVDQESGAGMTYDPCGTALGDMSPYRIVDANATDENATETYAYDYHPNVKGYTKMAKKWFDDMVASKWLPDIEVPVITLTGDNLQKVTLDSLYSDLGAVVSDNYDDNRTLTGTGTVDTSTEGNYTVSYDANDTAGNEAVQVTRTVEVTTAPDTTLPVITLTGESTINLMVGNAYTDAGATALDNQDGNITDDIILGGDTVNTNIAGTYVVTYNVTDAAGNTATEVKRTVIVSAAVANPDWLDYDENTQEATITPIAGGVSSTLRVDELAATKAATDNAITLMHTFGGTEAYIKALSSGQVNTGFKAGSVDDSTLKIGTLFKAGTKAVIKNIAGKVSIVTEVTLNTNESLTIGGN